MYIVGLGIGKQPSLPAAFGGLQNAKVEAMDSFAREPAAARA
jgi:hypothetical protein